MNRLADILKPCQPHSYEAVGKNMVFFLRKGSTKKYFKQDVLEIPLSETREAPCSYHTWFPSPEKPTRLEKEFLKDQLLQFWAKKHQMISNFVDTCTSTETICIYVYILYIFCHQPQSLQETTGTSHLKEWAMGHETSLLEGWGVEPWKCSKTTVCPFVAFC